MELNLLLIHVTNEMGYNFRVAVKIFKTKFSSFIQQILVLKSSIGLGQFHDVNDEHTVPLSQHRPFCIRESQIHDNWQPSSVLGMME